MRTLEQLTIEYPDLIGTELLLIQDCDQLSDQMEKFEQNLKVYDFIDDVNENGGYFKYEKYDNMTEKTIYFISNMDINENAEISGDVKYISFFGDGGVINVGESRKENINFEKLLKTSRRITEEEFKIALDAFEVMKKLIW